MPGEDDLSYIPVRNPTEEDDDDPRVLETQTRSSSRMSMVFLEFKITVQEVKWNHGLSDKRESLHKRDSTTSGNLNDSG
jgi:hypothetical protein